jgi:hypothetical protein
MDTLPFPCASLSIISSASKGREEQIGCDVGRGAWTKSWRMVEQHSGIIRKPATAVILPDYGAYDDSKH